MKWTIKAETEKGTIQSVEVEADSTEGIIPALEAKRLKLTRILSIEPHGVIPIGR